MLQSQDELKRDIKRWLKAQHYTYSWLAERCFVTETTVRNWMARRHIPTAKLHIIRGLMQQHTQLEQEQSHAVLAPAFESVIHHQLQQRAYAQGKTLMEYLVDSGSVNCFS